MEMTIFQLLLPIASVVKASVPKHDAVHVFFLLLKQASEKYK